ncbi:hypothetical protein C8F04DRAFT_1239011 [Mycena alexandri]|uniref:Uncharacterized protein n=1 Tax=Mycena alexandri TaxID=1745969 RepID=A0AAD6SD04_9AGAR|nr:hypothetical protein C8F04DRAFT_1239011 [Mycena alexandri]
MAYLAAQLADYRPEPLHLNDNAVQSLLSPAAESDTRNMFSPDSISKEQAEDYLDSGQLESRLRTLPEGLPGRRHPVTVVTQMTGFALAGAILAYGHHIYFVSLHRTPSDGTVRVGGQSVSRQKIPNFVATVLIFLVKLCLSQSISKAFDQRLWYTVRRRALRLSGLDALFSALGDPTVFLNLEMVWRAKMAAGLAFIAWTATFAVVPVPGSLTVQSIETQSVVDMSVPTLNLAKDPAGGAIYTVGPIGDYRTPGPIAQSVANKALVDEAFATLPSPCGSNSDCSYKLTFFAPSFKCSAPTTSAIQGVVPLWNVQTATQGTDTDTLNVQYVTIASTTLSQTNCTSFNSTYSLTFEFRDNQQTINISEITLGSSFGTAGHIMIDDPIYRPALAAIKDAVSTALVGSVLQDPQTGLAVSGLALYSALANNTISTNPVFLPNTPRLIEELLTNTTISMIARNLWNTTVSAHVVRDVNVFVYQPHALWASYGAAVGVTLLCMAVGLHALWRNGGGGGKAFSLIMATTRNPALDGVTNRALHEKEYRETYSKLRFRYTNLGDREGDRLAFRES